MKKIIKIFTCLIACIACLIACLAFTGNMEFMSKNRKGLPKYVFLFIGDGMSYNNVALAESYLSYKSGKLGGEQLLFTSFPVHGSATSHSADSRVTDSSASGTAIACGSKTNNNMVGVAPDGNPLKSISYELKDMGYNVGIISSVPVNHATPSAFYAHNKSRSDYYNITGQIPSSGFDFFAGSGMIDYFGTKEDIKESSAKMLEDKGINVCFGIDEAEEAIRNNDRIVVCQPYNQEKEAANYDAGGEVPEGHITLSEFLQLGLERLDDKEPFFIMCEGGDIDWAAHGQKTMPTIFSIIEFNKAIAVAYEFYMKHPDETLIVVTADHGTGGASFSYEPRWKVMDSIWVASGKKNVLSGKENMAMNTENNIHWGTSGHTGEPVPVYAVGKGAEKFSGRIDNTDIKGKILGK